MTRTPARLLPSNIFLLPSRGLYHRKTRLPQAGVSTTFLENSFSWGLRPDFSTDFTNFAKQYGWIGSEGRGAGNAYKGSSEFKTINDVMKHMKENNIDPTKPEGLEIIRKFEEAQK